MNGILRPEYYTLPLKHPANCRCSEHASKIDFRATSAPMLREAMAQIAMLLAAPKPSR